MEIKVDCYVRRDVCNAYDGYKDIFHYTITEEDLLEILRQRIHDEYGGVELDDIAIEGFSL